MEEREENHHERLEKQFSKLEEEWTTMKTGKTSSAVSRLTVEEEALIELVKNSPRNLMLSLQNDPEPEEMIDQISSPSFRRKLFHDSSSDADDNKTKTTSLSHSSCCSSDGIRMRDNNTKTNKCRRIFFVTMLLLLLLSWLLINGFDHFSVTTQINNLVPT